MELLASKVKESQRDGKIRLYSIIALIVGLLVAVGGSFVGVTVLAESLGCLAGVLFFIFGYMVWFQLPLTLHEKVDLRGNWDIGKRRWTAGWTVLMWFLLLGLGGHFFPKTLVGGLNVAVLLTLWRVISLTKFERALDVAEANIASNWPVDPDLNNENGETEES